MDVQGCEVDQHIFDVRERLDDIIADGEIAVSEVSQTGRYHERSVQLHEPP